MLKISFGPSARHFPGKIVHESILKSNYQQNFQKQSTLVRGRFSWAEFFNRICCFRSFLDRLLVACLRPYLPFLRFPNIYIASPCKCVSVSSTSLSLFAPTEILTGKCCGTTIRLVTKPCLLADTSRLAILTSQRGASAMTQITIGQSRSMLLILSATLSVLLVIFLETTR